MDRSDGNKPALTGVLEVMPIPTANSFASYNASNLSEYYIDADNDSDGVLVSITQV